jgi:hypothetical protein
MPKVTLEYDLPNLDDEDGMFWSRWIQELVCGFLLLIGLWIVWGRLLVLDLVLLYNGMNKI